MLETFNSSTELRIQGGKYLEVVRLIHDIPDVPYTSRVGLHPTPCLCFCISYGN